MEGRLACADQKPWRTGSPATPDETRGAGWEFLYVAVDDTRAGLRRHGFLMSICSRSRRGVLITHDGDLWLQLCRPVPGCLPRTPLKHIRTRIYTPRTNGKAERFIKTALNEWAYARLYQNSAERNRWLEPWIHQYNWHRPHAGLNQKPPISRAGLDVNNLLRHHS